MTAIQLDPGAPVVARRTLHHDPPTSPSRVLCGPQAVIRHVGLVFLLLAMAALVDHASLLLRVDLPIERFVISHRTAGLDDAFRRISFFGSTKVVLVGGAALAIAAWRRCRMVALLVVASTLTRPLVEHLLKIAVGRPRPQLSQMVNGVGYSFPSGHVMASSTLWLMVPVVLSLYHSSRKVWWASVVGSLTAVALISASRVYLGVHWFSDVVAGALAAAVLLAGLDLGFRRLHERRHCPASPCDAAELPAAA
jgi:undecaprenyl-diphosphatase